MLIVEDFIFLFGALVGLPTFITVVVNILKKVGLVKDGYGEQWAQWMNFVAFIALFVVGQFFPEVDLGAVDEFALQIANLGAFALALLPIGMKVSGVAHDAMAGLPLIGHQT